MKVILFPQPSKGQTAEQQAEALWQEMEQLKLLSDYIKKRNAVITQQLGDIFLS